MRIIFVLGVFSTVSRINAQLFPFTNLKHLVEHKSEERHTEPPASPTYNSDLNTQLRVDDDQRKEPLGTSNLPNFPAAPVLDQSTPFDAEERTVIVTPKPKYTPQRLAPEPQLDPNSDLIPSMGYKPSNQQQPVRSLTINPPPEPQQHNPEQAVRFSTVVESVPSLSVQIQDDSTHKRKLPDGIVDYLVPPKYPSVYETVGLLPKSQSNVIDNDDHPTENLRPQKRKKNRNKASNYSPYKDNEDDAEKASSDKTKVRTVRPKRPRPIHVPSIPTVKVTASPPRKKLNRSPSTMNPPVIPNRLTGTSTEEETDNESSASDLYFKPRPHESQHHFEMPFADHEVAQNSFGLGGSTGERVEFQMHGQSGPESYKFGFDTGEGKNRHFRYEEKDGHGNVKGHYGYYDKSGKLQVVNYNADKHGFHANAA